MLNITDMKKEEKKPPIFRLAFRPFFLFGSLFSVLAILLWGLFLNSTPLSFQPHGGWLWWHGHEMLYGFGVAIIVGFLLTAIQNWSGMPGLSGWPLAGLFGFWLIGRILMLYPLVAPQIIAIVDTLFLPLAALALGWPIVRAKLWRNLMFIPLLLLLAWVNGQSHWRLLDGSIQSLAATQGAILLITLIIVIMGGRVIPFFTANAMGRNKPQPNLMLEIFSILPLVIASLYIIVSQHLMPQVWLGILFLFSAVANAIRFGRWNGQLTFSNSLLWSLHLAYLLIIFSLGLLSCYHFGLPVPLTSALHGLTIGGMGLMILAMISRVSLGHTGRPLKVSKWMTISYLSIFLATLFRVVAPLTSDLPNTWYILSSILWVFAFMVFVTLYWPVLTQPRADGRPG